MGHHLREPFGLRVRQRSQEDAVYDGIHCRVRANTQGKRGHGGNREGGILPKDANGVSKIAHLATLDDTDHLNVDHYHPKPGDPGSDQGQI